MDEKILTEILDHIPSAAAPPPKLFAAANLRIIAEMFS